LADWQKALLPTLGAANPTQRTSVSGKFTVTHMAPAHLPWKHCHLITLRLIPQQIIQFADLQNALLPTLGAVKPTQRLSASRKFIAAHMAPAQGLDAR